MFPLSVPSKHLEDVDPGSWVLDPFCGRGTTNFAARLLSVASVGVDSSPIAAAIAQGKMVDVLADSIEIACADILAEEAPVEVPEGPFWELCYHPKTLVNIVRLRNALLQDCSSAPRQALRALLLGLLHGPRAKRQPSYLSNQMPRTYAAKPDYAVRFWTKKQLLPELVDIVELVGRKARYYFFSPLPKVSFKVVCADSRNLDFSALGPKFSCVITSPPYYGMVSYIQDQWLRYWFLGGPATVTYWHKDQMTHKSAPEFTQQLAQTWRNVASACLPGAKMVIRFGGVHNRKGDPMDIMRTSLREANSNLNVLKVTSAGFSSNGHRQANQFQSQALRSPIEEFDFCVRVET